MESVKARLLAACLQYVDQRISTSRTAMNQAQASANEEGKSSAGDKYETGRAMMQIERDKAAHQLDESMKLRQTLESLVLTAPAQTVRPGSLVTTTSQTIFVAIGIGKLAVDGNEYLVVGPASPLGKNLIGKGTNDVFTLGFREERIVKIE